MNTIKLHKRPFITRFVMSYKAWRKYLGVIESLHAAWMVTTAGRGGSKV